MVLIGLWLMQLLNRRRMMGSVEEEEQLVWVTLYTVFMKTNFYNIPIHALADIGVTEKNEFCRIVTYPEPGDRRNQSNIYANSRISLEGHDSSPARIMFSNLTASDPGSGWISPTTAGMITENITLYGDSSSSSAKVYYNNDSSKISPYDTLGPGVVYLGAFQTNAPLYSYAALIPVSYLH